MGITKRFSLAGIFSALATLTFIIENLFPPLFIPGAKMGLSNVFILLSAIFIGKFYGYAVLTVKILIGSLATGNISAVMYSIPSGLISYTVEMLLIFYLKKTSLLCASVFGAVINITLQNTVFCLITETSDYLIYLPYLSIIGAVSGLIVGITVTLIGKRFYIYNKDKENSFEFN